MRSQSPNLIFQIIIRLTCTCGLCGCSLHSSHSRSILPPISPKNDFLLSPSRPYLECSILPVPPSFPSRFGHRPFIVRRQRQAAIRHPADMSLRGSLLPCLFFFLLLSIVCAKAPSWCCSPPRNYEVTGHRSSSAVHFAL